MRELLQVRPMFERSCRSIKPSTYLKTNIFLCFVFHKLAKIIYNLDEVSFVQNLIYYMERAYRVPDYGIWGRGSKYNTGKPELHAR